MGTLVLVNSFRISREGVFWLLCFRTDLEKLEEKAAEQKKAGLSCLGSALAMCTFVCLVPRPPLEA